ncbi:MAG: SDR family oxidoreductase [Armatimonadetes bacterium]|nr:SDR family oxidoreductase [Armatimonadota bacterium]
MKYFLGKQVLLTGGSSGIGLAAARILRGSGAELILVARDPERLERARQELAGLPGPGEVLTLGLDVGDPRAVEASGLGERPLDVLIHNAGISRPGNFLDLPPSTFEEMLRVNYLGSVHLTRLILPGMLERGGGHIAFVCSLLGVMGIGGYSAYAASKFAMRGFAECLRGELRAHRIRVSVCYPPDTDTPQHEAEKQWLPPETVAIARWGGCMSAEAVAGALLRGMAANRFQILPGLEARFLEMASRFFPGWVRWALDRIAATARGT